MKFKQDKTKQKNTLHSITEFLDNIKYYMPDLWAIQLRQGSEEHLWLKYSFISIQILKQNNQIKIQNLKTRAKEG